VYTTSDTIGMIEIISEENKYVSPAGGEFSVWALVFCANIFSTAHIVLEIIGLLFFVLCGILIFWRTNILDITGSGGFWVTGFIGIIFYNVSFYALRSMIWNSRTSEYGAWNLSGLNNGWLMYLISNLAALIMVIVSLWMQKKLFDPLVLGIQNRSKVGVIILKIGTSIGFFFIFTSLIFAVYGRDYKIGLYFIVGGLAIVLVIFISYVTAYLMNKDSRNISAVDEEDKLPLVQ
jgi:hypothetical protein